MFKSNAKYYIKETISSTDITGATFKISPDFELGEELETDGGTASVILSDGIQIERMTITATGGIATIVKRGLTQDDVLTEDSNLNKTWNDGAIMTITAFAFDLPDLDKSSGRNTFTSDVEISNTKKMYVGDNAYITTVNNGTDLILKDGNNSETTLSELTAGAGTDHKVKVSATDTTAEFLNTKLTAGDGLSKTLVNGGSNESIDFDIDLADTTIFSTSGANSRAVVTDSSGNLFQATETQRGGVEKATNAEVVTGTDNTRYVTPLDLKTNYGITTHGTQTTVSVDTGTGGPGDFYSSTLTTTGISYAEVTLRAVDTGSSFSRLEYRATSGDAWASVYSHSPAGDSSILIKFMCKKGEYRIYCDRNFTGGTTLSGTLTTTI